MLGRALLCLAAAVLFDASRGQAVPDAPAVRSATMCRLVNETVPSQNPSLILPHLMTAPTTADCINTFGADTDICDGNAATLTTATVEERMPTAVWTRNIWRSSSSTDLARNPRFAGTPFPSLPSINPPQPFNIELWWLLRPHDHHKHCARGRRLQLYHATSNHVFTKASSFVLGVCVLFLTVLLYIIFYICYNILSCILSGQQREAAGCKRTCTPPAMVECKRTCTAPAVAGCKRTCPVVSPTRMNVLKYPHLVAAVLCCSVLKYPHLVAALLCCSVLQTAEAAPVAATAPAHLAATSLPAIIAASVGVLVLVLVLFGCIHGSRAGGGEQQEVEFWSTGKTKAAATTGESKLKIQVDQLGAVYTSLGKAMTNLVALKRELEVLKKEMETAKYKKHHQTNNIDPMEKRVKAAAALVDKFTNESVDMRQRFAAEAMVEAKACEKLYSDIFRDAASGIGAAAVATIREKVSSLLAGLPPAPKEKGTKAARQPEGQTVEELQVTGVKEAKEMFKEAMSSLDAAGIDREQLDGSSVCESIKSAGRGFEKVLERELSS